MTVVREGNTADSEEDQEAEESGEEEEFEEESEGVDDVENENENGDSHGRDGKDHDASRHRPHGAHQEEGDGHADVGGSEGSPQRSRAPSPTDSLIAHTSALQLRSPTKTSHRAGTDESEEGEAKLSRDAIRERIASDITRLQARQTSKYHSKRSTRRVGRPKGSKAKQDTRVKIDRSGVWD